MNLKSTLTKRGAMDFTYEQIAKMIDHALHFPVLTDEDLENGCQLALDYDVAGVSVKPYSVKRCVEFLKGSTVKVIAPIGFPHGGHTISVKVAETREALADGAQEVDMVVNIGKVLSGDWDYVLQDIGAVVEVAREGGALVKVIFENCYLRDEHKIKLCEICGDIGADFVKTSTGYAEGGATDEDLRLMRRHSPAHVQIKAAGEVRTLDRLLEVRALGVTRVGASRTAAILDECRKRLGK
jgi:deoxyribose-phosphate aldolase